MAYSEKQIDQENKAWVRNARRERRKKRKSAKKQSRVVKPGRMYAQRNDSLKRIGFDSYRQYMASALWETIRTRVLSDRPRCELCQAKRSTQVHHQSYAEDVMAGREDTGLVATCGGCHRFVEFDGTTKRRDTEVRDVARAMRRKARRISEEHAELDRQFDCAVTGSE